MKRNWSFCDPCRLENRTTRHGRGASTGRPPFLPITGRITERHRPQNAAVFLVVPVPLPPKLAFLSKEIDQYLAAPAKNLANNRALLVTKGALERLPCSATILKHVILGRLSIISDFWRFCLDRGTVRSYCSFFFDISLRNSAVSTGTI